MTTTKAVPPPMDPNTSEATQPQLDLARKQGDAYGEALKYMTDTVAQDGGEQPAGPYNIGYAVEDAEGMFEWDNGSLTWRDPGEKNMHVEVAVRDLSDGRFVPGVKVFVTMVAPDGQELGPYEQPLLLHPMIYHYGRNWNLPADGTYSMKIRVEPPTFMRHDEINGMRFTEVVEATFDKVKVKRGEKSP